MRRVLNLLSIRRRALAAGAVVLASAAAMAFAAPRGAAEIAAPEGPAAGEARRPRGHRDMAHTVTMDHLLVQADFIGVVAVREIHPAEAGDGLLIEVDVADAWFTRWQSPARLTVFVRSLGGLGAIVEPGAQLVVFLSGGPFEDAPLTAGAHGVFRAEEDGGVACASGNPLFAVHNAGFVCSVQAYMPSAPIALDEMRAETLARRDLAAARLPGLASRLDREARPLETQPTPANEIEVSR